MGAIPLPQSVVNFEVTAPGLEACTHLAVDLEVRSNIHRRAAPRPCSSAVT